MTRNPRPPEPPGDWTRIDTRAEFDARIAQDKQQTMEALHVWALRIAMEEAPGNVGAATAAIITKAWPLCERQIEQEAALIRRQIAPSLATVGTAPGPSSIQ